MRNRSQLQSRAGRICGYVCLLLAPQFGESQDAGATLTLSPAALQFGSQAVGSTSKVQLAKLSNQGTTTVTNIAISATGDFAQTNTCGTSLAPNASCSINVSFAPTASGLRSGTLKVASSTGTPLTSALSGIGYSLVSISLTPSNPTIAAQTIIALQATGSYDDGSTRNISSSVQWTSAAPAIATVDTSGIVTGVAPGPATITATSGSISGSTKVTVTSATLTSIYITAQRATPAQGITEQLTATGTFSDRTTQNISNSVTWTSLAPTVISVSNSGLIFTLAQGSSTIKATLGSVSGYKKITVTSVSLTSITVVLPPPPFAAGTKQQLQATGKFSDGSKQPLTGSVSWSSSSPSVATMDTLGRATALKTGSTTITATLGAKSGSTALTVVHLTVASIAVQASNTSIPAGITQPFTATGTFTDSSTENFTLSVHWTSSASAVATVSNAAGKEGIAQGLTPGTANIGAVFSPSLSGSAMLTVTPAVLVSIAITPANSTIPLGVAEQLTATGTYSDKSKQDLTNSAAWSSSMDTFASVTNGLVDAEGVGSATITASYQPASGGPITGFTLVSVGPAQLTAIVVSPGSTTIQKGTMQKFSATGVYTDASTQGMTTTVTWSSSATAVATISNAGGSQGLATGVAPGNTTITAAATGGSPNGSASLTVSSVPPPTITSFTPHSGAIGKPITVTGTNLQPSSGTAADVTLANQGGGTITALASSTTATKLTFVIPAGAATGPFTVMLNGSSATSATPLTVTAATTFTMTAAPSAATLVLPLAGQAPPLPSVSYAITLNSANAFDQLAALSVSGVPGGITATLTPAQVTAGQTSILTLTAPASQPTGPATLMISASASVNGLPVSASANVGLTVQAPTTSLIGRTVISNTLEIPIAGVTVKMLGLDGNGNSTGCTGNTVSDAAGNFALVNLSAMCVGSQLVGFNGATATAPPGKYAGVNLVFTLVSGQVTASPVLVHLPQINAVETFNVQQNASADQTYAYKTIPGLSVTVYAGTTFSLQDGTQPKPFPLAAVQVPVDRLPDAKPFVPTMMRVFIVAFQPANATTCSPSGQCQPVAVYFPNTINTPPNTNMPLMTLDPTHGQMVPYGTGTVSSDGTQIVPDLDPAHPGHRFGLVHFDWHGPMPPNPPPTNPSPTCQCPPAAPCSCPVTAGQPVDVSSGVDVIKATDIEINGPRGRISVDRVFRTMSSNPGPFGIGTSFNYGYQLGTFGIINLIMPDGNQFPFNVQSAGALTNNTIPSLIGAVMTTSSGGYNIRWKDGSVYHFTSIGGRIAFLASITDANGNTVTLTLNPSIPGQITQITDPVGRSLNLAYDSSNRITTITDPIGRMVQYTYNSAGYLATVIDPNNGQTTYTYDSQNNLTTVKDPRGILTEQNTYDANGRVSQQIQADGGVYKFAYTLSNPMVPTSSPLLTVVTDPMGGQTTNRFNANQLLTDVTDASGQTTTSTLDPTHSQLVTAISGIAECAVCGNPAQGNQSYTLDQNGNVLTSTDANGNTTTYTYDPVFNKVTSIADPVGDVTYLTYDGAGNLLTRKDPNGNKTAFTYNAFGEVTQITDPLQNQTNFTYDSFGNLATVQDALKNTTFMAYDDISRLIETTDALGRRSQTQYDALSRIVAQTNAQYNTTKFMYDGVGNLLSVTDARKNTRSFTYDGLNRLLTRTTALNTSDSRSYDFNGNLTSFTDRRGQTSSYGYDSLNRLTSETYSDSAVARSYDANGRLAQVNDSASGVFTFIYDMAGRRTASTNPAGALQYTYDKANRMASRTVVGQAAVQYAYDKASNLTSASTPSAGITLTYDPRNLISTEARANGVGSLYSYDALQRLLSLTHTGPGGTLSSQTYAYDAVSNRSSVTNNIAQALVTQAVGAAAYDPNNEQNQFGSITNSFDANGNMLSSTTSTGSTNYTWDSRNRLSAIATSAGLTTTFIYDFTGNLIRQADAGPSLNLTKTFILDDLTNEAYVSRSDGDQYLVLAGRTIDQHIAAVHASGQIEYGLPDAINSTIATVDQTGALKGKLEYEPFGQTTATGTTDPFQYTGRVLVSNALYYYRARFYSPTTERFLSEDPVGGQSTQDRYVYVRNSPINLADPSGQVPGFQGNDPGVCDRAYGPCVAFAGANARCFCKCAGNDPWAQYVRSCLINLVQQGYSLDQAHFICYHLATAIFGPLIPLPDLIRCSAACESEQKDKCGNCKAP